MSARTETAATPAVVISAPRHRPWSDLFEREGTLGYILMAPALLILIIFLAYPFVLGIWFSLSSAKIGVPGAFIGLAHFAEQLQTSIFQQVIKNTVLYTSVATVFKLVLGMALALLMNQIFPFKNLIRAGLLLPWIIPTALSTLAWLWMLDNSFSIVNWFLRETGLAGALAQSDFGRAIKINIRGIPWLGDGTWAMIAIIWVNVWRGTPFYAISLLAGLQTIPQDLYEAAAIDGASGWERFRYITLPLIMPVLTVVVLLSVIWTFADFQLVQVLTRGGPTNATHLFATYAYQVGMTVGDLGAGAAISLFMFPFLLVMVVVLLVWMRKETE